MNISLEKYHEENTLWSKQKRTKSGHMKK